MLPGAVGEGIGTSRGVSRGIGACSSKQLGQPVMQLWRWNVLQVELGCINFMISACDHEKALKMQKPLKTHANINKSELTRSSVPRQLGLLWDPSWRGMQTEGAQIWWYLQEFLIVFAFSELFHGRMHLSWNSCILTHRFCTFQHQSCMTGCPNCLLKEAPIPLDTLWEVATPSPTAPGSIFATFFHAFWKVYVEHLWPALDCS